MRNIEDFILVVDDDQSILDIIDYVSEGNASYRIERFSNPKEALEFMKKNLSACKRILSDVNMPGMDGIELYKKIREVGYKGPYAFMTADKCNVALLERYVEKESIWLKPFDIYEFRAKFLNSVV